MTPPTPSPPHVFVVPAYGESPFLRGCLRSLRTQTSASTVTVTTSTPCEAIAAASREFDAQLIVNPVRKGLAADWNFALEAVAAPLVTLAHQDDVYAPAFAERTAALFARTPRAGAAFTAYEEIDDTGAPTRSKISLVKHALRRIFIGSHEVIERRRMRRFLSLGNPLPCSSVTFNRLAVRDFRFKDALQSNLDWEAWLDLSAAGVLFVHSPERLVGRRHNPLTETSRLIREGVRRAEDEAMFARLWPRPVATLLALAYRSSYA